MIDVIAQPGRYKPNAASLQNDFIVEGEQRYLFLVMGLLHHKRLMMSPPVTRKDQRSEDRGLIWPKNKKLEPEAVVFFVCTDPEPVVVTAPLAS